MIISNRWVDVLEDFDFDGTTKDVRVERMAKHIAALEDMLTSVRLTPVENMLLTHHEVDTAEWMRPETLNLDGAMMVRHFLHDVQRLQDGILCDGSQGIASHTIQSHTLVKLVNPTTGNISYGNVKWVAATRMMDCGCEDGITIVAEEEG